MSFNISYERQIFFQIFNTLKMFKYQCRANEQNVVESSLTISLCLYIVYIK